MSFRTVNGSTHTENGWRCCNRDECGIVQIPDLFLTETAPLRTGAPLVILGAWLFWYDRNVEEITTSIWGWSRDNDVLGRWGMNEGSNHLSGTAVDINAPKYPWGSKTMSADKIAKVQAGQRLFSLDGTVENSFIFWGRGWSKPDEMHYQMAFPEGDKLNDIFAQKLLNGYLGIYAPDDGSETPTPTRKLVVPAEGGTFWNDVSQYQQIPVTKAYPNKVFSFRTNSGDITDNLAAENARVAKDLLDSGQLEIVIPYYFFRPGQANCDLHREILEAAGLFNHPRTVTMVDVEGANGTVTGNNSLEINDEVNRIRGWYNNSQRVIGYLNSNADPNLWPTRNGINLVVPQYGRTPGDISSIRDSQVKVDAIAHQFTSTATDQIPWNGKNVDVNWSPYSIDELLILFGMKELEGEDDWMSNPEAMAILKDMQKKVTEIHDRLIALPWFEDHMWPSNAIFRDSNKGVGDTVQMLLNTDGNNWDVKVLLAAMMGSTKNIARIERLANGQGPAGTNPGAVELAQEVLGFVKAIKGENESD